MDAIAYIPTKDTHDLPNGNSEKVLIKGLKTSRGIIRRAIKTLGENVIVKRYSNIYDTGTFHSIYRGNECECAQCFS